MANERADPPGLRYVAARPEIERFYHDVTASALVNGLSDAELAAVLSTICGRMIGAAKPGIDLDTIRDTVIHNIQQGRVDMPSLLAAAGKGKN